MINQLCIHSSPITHHPSHTTHHLSQIITHTSPTIITISQFLFFPPSSLTSCLYSYMAPNSLKLHPNMPGDYYCIQPRNTMPVFFKETKALLQDKICWQIVLLLVNATTLGERMRLHVVLRNVHFII